MKEFLSEGVIVDRVSNAVAAGTTVVNSAGVQLGAGNSVLFIVIFGTITTAPTVHAEQSSDDSTYNDLAGTELADLADTDDNLVALLDVRDVQDEYVRCVVDRSSGNVVIDAILAIKYDCKEHPVTQTSDVASHEKHLSPSEGTK